MEINGSCREEYEKILGDKNIFNGKSIRPSELYCFWMYSKKYKINKVIESGTHYGRTAIRLSLLFPECEIITYESRKDRYKIGSKNCKKYKNIKSVFGKFKPRKHKTDKNTAVIIDGPHGGNAIGMALELLNKCAFVAIHDMHDYVETLEFVYGDMLFHTGSVSKELKDMDEAEEYTNNYYGKVLAIIGGQNDKSEKE